MIENKSIVLVKFTYCIHQSDDIFITKTLFEKHANLGLNTMPSQAAILRYVFALSMIFNVTVYWFYFVVGFARESGLAGSFLNDFYNTYMEAAQNFLGDPRALYVDDMGDFWVFRSLPAAILYYLPFYLVPANDFINLILCSLIIYFWNLGSCWMIFRLMNADEIKSITRGHLLGSPYLLASVYLLLSFHIGEYILGQSNAIAGFFVLCGLYYMIKKKEHLGFLFLSISLIFKMTTVFLLILLILAKPSERLYRNIIYALIPQIPSIIMFITWPNLIHDFILTNFQISEEILLFGYKGAGTGSSGTLSTFLFQNLAIPLQVSTITISLVVFPLTFYVVRARKADLSVIDQFMIIFLSIIVTVPTFWWNHVFLYLGVYLIWLSSKTSWVDKRLKWVLIVPTVLSVPWFIFPFNTFFYIIPLGLLDYSLIKHARTRNQQLASSQMQLGGNTPSRAGQDEPA